MSQPSIKFAGMCVGGPMAGLHVVKESATFKCATEISLPRVSGVALPDHTVQNYHYKHITLLVVQDGQTRSWDFFASRDCAIGDVLDELLEDYSRYQDLKT